MEDLSQNAASEKNKSDNLSRNATSEKNKSDPLRLAQDRTHLTYTSCYCEENVWKLCEEIERRSSKDKDKDDSSRTNEDPLSRTYAVFISNPSKSVPIWCQRSSKNPRSVPVVWDYHVILIYRGKEAVKKDVKDREPSSPPSSSLSSSSPPSSSLSSSSWVYDLDTILPFPESFTTYFDESFGNEEELKPRFKRFFRVIPAKEYLSRFASDRRHMKKPDGSWAMPPPPYPSIVAKDGTRNNIDDCIDVTNERTFGQIMNAKQFYDFFAHPS